MPGPAYHEFVDLLAASGVEVPLDRAVLLVAADDHRVDVDERLAELDELSSRMGAPDVASLREVLFAGESPLQGDVTSYDDPANSHLDRVLDRRRGLPILLAVLTVELARRQGLALAPVCMPGHVVVATGRDGAGEPDRFLDAFNGGIELDRRGCERLFRRIHGDGPRWDPSFLEPTPPRALLARVLANLEASHARRRQRASVARVLWLRSALLPDDLALHRRLSSASAAAGDHVGAAEALAPLLRARPGDAELARRSQALRARAN